MSLQCNKRALDSESYTYTTYRKKMYRHTWVIDMFSKQLANSKIGQCMKSNSFGGVNNDSFFVGLYLKGVVADNVKDNVSMFLYWSHSNQFEIEFKSYVLTAVKEKYNESLIIKKFDKAGGFGWSKYLDSAALLEKKHVYLPNDQLTLVFELEILTKLKISSLPSSAEICKKPCRCMTFGNVCDSSKYSDFTLHVGNEILKVHKIILATQSPVFAAMFDHDMIENKQNSTVIEDIDYNVMKAAIQYIYTGECPNLNEMAPELLEVADKYAFQDLKNICENKLCSTICVQNAGNILTLADRHNAAKLKMTAINFIKDNIHVIIQSRYY